jgi:hypothetical protein
MRETDLVRALRKASPAELPCGACDISGARNAPRRPGTARQPPQGLPQTAIFEIRP